MLAGAHKDNRFPDLHVDLSDASLAGLVGRWILEDQVPAGGAEAVAAQMRHIQARIVRAGTGVVGCCVSAIAVQPDVVRQWAGLGLLEVHLAVAADLRCCAIHQAATVAVNRKRLDDGASCGEIQKRHALDV